MQLRDGMGKGRLVLLMIFVSLLGHPHAAIRKREYRGLLLENLSSCYPPERFGEEAPRYLTSTFFGTCRIFLASELRYTEKDKEGVRKGKTWSGRGIITRETLLMQCAPVDESVGYFRDRVQ
jgi:hypothetical protein